jgi:hypothetical protein
MSTTPPEPQPTQQRSFTMPPATMPIPGNAEFLLYLAVLVVFAIIWAVSDRLDAGGFVTATTVLTAAYFISRGIAKASRVYEQ